MKVLFLVLLITFVSVGCMQVSRNKISFSDDIQFIRERLVRTDSIFRKITNKIEAIQFDTTYIYLSGKTVKMDSIPRYPFNNLSSQDYATFTDNLRILAKNNINSIRGTLRNGFTMFGFKLRNDDGWYDTRYLAIDTLGFKLPKEFRELDRKDVLILFVNK